MKHEHWHYFAALSEDVERTARFVEPTQDNFNTYSIEFARLYLTTGSEIDVVAKLLCNKANPKVRLKGIDTYRPVILARYPDFPDVELHVPRGDLSLTPWKEWRNGKNPEWWRHYNDVKHERDKYFKEANLENVLNALGGLLVAIGYLYAEDLRDTHLAFSSNFMKFSGKYYFGFSLGPKGAGTGYRLPGIPMSEIVLKARKATGIPLGQ